MRRAFSLALFASSLLSASSLSLPSEAQVLRFSATAPGVVLAVGNTLGLSKALNDNAAGTRDSIGTFISPLVTADLTPMPIDVLNAWPMGTTNDWTMNGSTAVLTLPDESQVLYAELVWGGSTSYGGQDVSALLSTPVSLSIGASTSLIAPDPSTALTIAQQANGFFANYYMRSADVTAFVKAAGSGTYSVSGVPATEATTINSLNAAGWTLAVVVRDPSSPIRNLSVFVGGSFVDENSQQDYSVSGFCTPPGGLVSGSAVVSTIEGDANLTGDQLLIAPTSAGPFVNLSGPNNPANNFFCSQINGADGTLDTQGSFGNKNHDPVNGVNVIGGRQGWDITTVPLSSAQGQLQNGQTSAVLRTITTGDSYAPIFAAFAIDVNAPDFSGAGASFDVSPLSVTLGDTLTVTFDLQNNGQVTADNLMLTLPLEAGLSLASFTMDGQSGDINGAPVNGAKLAAGVDAGALGPGESRHVVLTADVSGPPQGAKYLLTPEWNYTFVVCAGGAPLPESVTKLTLVGYDAPMTTTSSSSSSSSGGEGGAGGGSGGEGGMGQGNSGAGGEINVGAPGGCDCAVESDSGAKPEGALGLAILGALGAMARRRRKGSWRRG